MNLYTTHPNKQKVISAPRCQTNRNVFSSRGKTSGHDKRMGKTHS